MTTPNAGKVYLIGAGPGDPGLLTLRAAECLRLADFVLYDYLVSDRVLTHVRPDAHRVCVNELPGAHPQRWPHIHRLMIDEAQAGRHVARLKGGDPLIFARGGEEITALREAGVDYEVVPGVTAALAAGAYLDVPLTHRRCASAVALVTGHENPTKTERLDWAALAQFPGTLAIYMGIARLPLIVQELTRHGLDGTTPAAVVRYASTGMQVAVTATLGTLESARRRQGIDAPALILVGDAVGHRPERSWFEGLPLLGRRVVVTRPHGQAEPMMRSLEQLGAVPYHLPTLRITDPGGPEAVDDAVARLAAGGFDWLAFTSANGVRYLIDRLKAAGRDLRALGGVKLAAIGPATADALRAYHLEPDVVPADGFRSEALADAMAPLAAGKRVLLARADRGRDVLRERLAAVAEVEQVAVYSQRDWLDEDSEVLDHLRRGEIDFVTFTSPNNARVFLRGIDETVVGRVRSGRTRLVCISDVTGAAVRECGFPVAGEAAEETGDGVIAEVVRLAAGSADVFEGVERQVDDDAAHEDAGDVDQGVADEQANEEVG